MVMGMSSALHQDRPFFLTEALILSPLHSSSQKKKMELERHMVRHEASHDADERHCDLVKECNLIEALEVCCQMFPFFK